MSMDDELRRLEEALARIRPIGDAQEHVMLEQQAIATPDYSWPPAPNTTHPWHEKHAGMVRQYMAEGRWEAMVAPPRTPLYRAITQPMDAAPTLDDMPQPIRLEVRVARAPAPFVGTEFVYEWKVAVDPYNRWVAGDSTPLYRTMGPVGA